MDDPLAPLKSPRLAGWTLRLFTAAAELPVIGALLRRSMISSAGIPQFREIQAATPPTVAPPLPGVADLSNPPAGSAADRFPAPDSRALDSAAYPAVLTTPEETAERFLAAHAATESSAPPLRAFISVDAADLREQARASTRRHREGRPAGPLDGVPVAVKDELDQPPYPTTVGTRFLGRAPARADATVVARLRAAGALLVGKTNMHEVGLGITGINPHHGTPRNPYDPSRITGGSSSGSASAVAAGLCPVAVSADAGGSIRIPAALCGVVGLKPTFGRVSEHGAFPLCWSMAHIGPIGATARDVALAYLAMAGPDPRDPNTRRQPPPTLGRCLEPDLRGVRIGVCRPWFEHADPDVVTACRTLLDAFTAAGAVVVEIAIPDLCLVRPVHLVTAACEWAAAFARQYREDRRAFGLDVRLTLLLARSLAPADYVHAQRLRHRVCANFASALQDVDVIATPTTASTALPISPDALATGESDFVTLDRMTRFITAANVTGLPAISVPAGYDSLGLPIGMQFLARPWREDVLLGVATAAEARVERRRPRIFHPVREDGPRRTSPASSR